MGLSIHVNINVEGFYGGVGTDDGVFATCFVEGYSATVDRGDEGLNAVSTQPPGKDDDVVNIPPDG